MDMHLGYFLITKLRVVCLGLGCIGDSKQINRYFYHRAQNANIGGKDLK